MAAEGRLWRGPWILLGLAACGGPAFGTPYLEALRAGQRAYSAGRYEEAAGEFAHAADAAQRVKDRDEALFLRARMFERLERWDEAKAAYRELLRRSPDGPRAPRAAFELGTLEVKYGDEAAGWTATRQALVRYPSHGSASRALELWAQHLGETEGEAAAREALGSLLAEVRETELEQRVEYEMARSFQREGSSEQAHDAFLRAAREHPYPFGNLTDDALWNASLLAEELGRYPLAIEHLRELLAPREDAVGGSYERPRFPAAHMRIAELYRDRMGDLDAARAAFKVTHREHATSILADDAMWQEARMAHLRGDEDAACDVVESLVDRYPDSRYVRCGHLLCTTSSPREDDCPGYIARDVPLDAEMKSE